MSIAGLAFVVVCAAILVRQVFVLSAVIRSARFLHRPVEPGGRVSHATARPVFFVVLPVLRESALIADTVTHFKSLIDGHHARLIVVTTEREALEAPANAPDTIAVVRRLADGGDIVHLHYPDPSGIKADQLNYAARHCSTLLGGTPPDRAFMVCYDADSRPPPDSLDQFARAAAQRPEASVFHQSSRFELRRAPTEHTPHRFPLLAQGVAEGAALRANRFVLGFELPRLRNRSAPTNRLKRWLSGYVYAHVTGHGLCIRLSLLLELPFPARSPLEDMHHSFYLGSRNLPMIAVPSLDRAEVPATVHEQIGQAARWFFGPARVVRYLRDPATRRGARATAMAFSALGSAAEWLGCAVVPVATSAAAIAGPAPLRLLAGSVVATYVVQLIVTDAAIGAEGSTVRRLTRILWCPVATTAFGVGGVIGLTRLLRGGNGVGKTERP